MAKIQDTKIKETSGGYDRLFGIPALGSLISRIQSAVISSGTELERMILERVQQIDDLDRFLQIEIMPDGVRIANKQQIKKCETIDFPGSEPDFLIFKRRDSKQNCYVVELKDGHQFDTKKASAERQSIHSFIERSAHQLQYRVSAHFCCFNQTDRKAIVAGFKNKITRQEAMTGREFCDLLEIDYDEIVSTRQEDQPVNVRFFLAELVKIHEIREALKRLLKNGNG